MTTSLNPAKLPTPAQIPCDPPIPDSQLIFDDGEPLETLRHRLAMNLLIDSAQSALLGAERNDFFVGGNMFVYYAADQRMNRDFRGPDFFAVLGVERERERKGWVLWQEDWKFPDVIIELLSSSTAQVDKGIKKDLYEQRFKTPNYFIYDPFDPNSLQGWHLDAQGQYQPLQPNPKGWLWCQALGLWLGNWQGRAYLHPPVEDCTWLRFYDRTGQLIPNLDEQAWLKAQQAESRLAQAQEQVEQEKIRAQQAEEQVEMEKSLREALIAKLKAKGIDPDQL
jgi:Uma2 family endonuclease